MTDRVSGDYGEGSNSSLYCSREVDGHDDEEEGVSLISFNLEILDKSVIYLIYQQTPCIHEKHRNHDT